MSNLTPMMSQYHKIKQDHPDKLVFFRLGDFYEMFYEDAISASRELEITLTSRNTDLSGKPIPMCGVPHHSSQKYLARLVQRGYKVAICEQVENPRVAKGIVRREVTRIITPGTVIDKDMLKSKENNFMASLLERADCVAASFLDLSTGEFSLSEFSGLQAWRQMEEELLHIAPRELIIPEEDEARLVGHLPDQVRISAVRTPQASWLFNLDHSRRILLDHFKLSTLEGFGLNGQHVAIAAAGALLSYAKQTQKLHLDHVSSLRFFEPTNHLKLDESTVHNLELVRGLDGNRQWTLLSTLDRTKTGMGARLLRNWLLRPSLKLKEIQCRLDAVEELQSSLTTIDRLEKILKLIHDLERLVGRVILETATARDLLALRDSLTALPSLSRFLQGCQSFLLNQKIDLLLEVVDLLERSISEDAPLKPNEGGTIRSGFNSKLDQLREISVSGKTFIAALQTRERDRTGISSLKVKYNKVFGYFLEVTRSHLKAVPTDYIRRQTLVGCERFVTPELKEYEEKIMGAEDRIVELERKLFNEVRNQVALQTRRIQDMARIIAQLDVLRGLAEVARRNHYIRPHLDPSQELRIRAGRHPVLELQSSNPFVPNDLHCDSRNNQLLILTGPNMGGKSTYLRQNALIVIMAQMGSFVPAKEAFIGLIDQIFTRVGASDNLARGRSTFMVEMIETANILHTATPRSLILLDEVGRGTATFDGLSIAWSVAEYLHTESTHKARTLFATHYQELTKLERLYEGIKNYCVTTRESEGEILFFHRVVPGIANRSYGIEVARLAGLPRPVLKRAHEILLRLERKAIDLSGQPRSSSSHQVIEELQSTLF